MKLAHARPADIQERYDSTGWHVDRDHRRVSRIRRRRQADARVRLPADGGEVRRLRADTDPHDWCRVDADARLGFAALAGTGNLPPVPKRGAAIARRVVAAALVVLAMLPGHVAAQGRDLLPDHRATIERFTLFTNCARMKLVTGGLTDDAADIRLTEERIQTVAESRLRAARLYDANVIHPWLFVIVHVAGSAFSIDVMLYKEVLDPASGLPGAAATWQDGSTGTHGKDAGYVLRALSESIDAFILDYLRVNEDACNASPDA